MTNDDGRKPEGAPERSPKAGVGAPSGVDGNGAKRFSVQRKMAVVARLLRGEPLELVARETNVSIARVWQGAQVAAPIPRTESGPGNASRWGRPNPGGDPPLIGTPKEGKVGLRRH